MTATDFIPGARRVVTLDRATLILGNTLTVLGALKGRYDAIVSDPPYGIKYGDIILDKPTHNGYV